MLQNQYAISLSMFMQSSAAESLGSLNDDSPLFIFALLAIQLSS